MLRAYGPLVEQGMWIVRCDQEMGELYKYLDRVTGIKNKKIRIYWLCSNNGSRKEILGI